jgi:hypothetical protein
MPTVRKIANPGATTNDERRPTTDERVTDNGHNVARQAVVAVDGLPIGWALTTLGTVCTKIQDGTHFSP